MAYDMTVDSVLEMLRDEYAALDKTFPEVFENLGRAVDGEGNESAWAQGARKRIADLKARQTKINQLVWDFKNEAAKLAPATESAGAQLPVRGALSGHNRTPDVP